MTAKEKVLKVIIDARCDKVGRHGYQVKNNNRAYSTLCSRESWAWAEAYRKLKK